MKLSILFTFFLIFFTDGLLLAQQSTATPENYTVFNREVSYEDGTIYLNAKANDGFLWLNDTNFKNGIIELDIKGKNAPGQSFVGVAFHGKDSQTFDAVYFRPFNFKNPQKNTHAIQYVSMPNNDWSTLRNAFPAKYESAIKPVPEKVDDWFHAKIVVDYPKVKVYVNGSDQPTLEVDQISDTKQGKVGLWVGNGSDGWFKNLIIKAEN